MDHQEKEKTTELSSRCQTEKKKKTTFKKKRSPSFHHVRPDLQTKETKERRPLVIVFHYRNPFFTSLH